MTLNDKKQWLKMREEIKTYLKDMKKVKGTVYDQKWQKMTKCHHEKKWQNITKDDTKGTTDTF